ncbi:MAG: livF [Cryobacterium sp.]|nr:livF [Cryobacterium sp.]
MIEHGTPDVTPATVDVRPDNGSLLKVTAVRAGYGDSTVLEGVSCHVSAGEFVALIGRNGVGKSTLMKAVTGRLPVRSGAVTWKGVNLERWSSHRRVRNGMRWVDEDRGVFPNLTVGENLAVAGKPLPRSLAYSVDAIMDNFPKLREKSAQRAASLSGGEQRMLALARAIAARP